MYDLQGLSPHQTSALWWEFNELLLILDLSDGPTEQLVGKKASFILISNIFVWNKLLTFI